MRRKSSSLLLSTILLLFALVLPHHFTIASSSSLTFDDSSNDIQSHLSSLPSFPPLPQHLEGGESEEDATAIPQALMEVDSTSSSSQQSHNQQQKPHRLAEPPAVAAALQGEGDTDFDVAAELPPLEPAFLESASSSQSTSASTVDSSVDVDDDLTAPQSTLALASLLPSTVRDPLIAALAIEVPSPDTFMKDDAFVQEMEMEHEKEQGHADQEQDTQAEGATDADSETNTEGEQEQEDKEYQNPIFGSETLTKAERRRIPKSNPSDLLPPDDPAASAPQSLPPLSSHATDAGWLLHSPAPHQPGYSRRFRTARGKFDPHGNAFEDHLVSDLRARGAKQPFPHHGGHPKAPHNEGRSNAHANLPAKPQSRHVLATKKGSKQNTFPNIKKKRDAAHRKRMQKRRAAKEAASKKRDQAERKEEERRAKHEIRQQEVDRRAATLPSWLRERLNRQNPYLIPGGRGGSSKFAAGGAGGGKSGKSTLGKLGVLGAAGIGAGIAGAGYLGNKLKNANWKGLGNKLKSGFGSLKNKLGAAGRGIKSLAKKIPFRKIGSGIASGAKKLGHGVASGAKHLGKAAAPTARRAWGGIKRGGRWLGRNARKGAHATANAAGSVSGSVTASVRLKQLESKARRGEIGENEYEQGLVEIQEELMSGGEGESDSDSDADSDSDSDADMDADTEGEAAIEAQVESELDSEQDPDSGEGNYRPPSLTSQLAGFALEGAFDHMTAQREEQKEENNRFKDDQAAADAAKASLERIQAIHDKRETVLTRHRDADFKRKANLRTMFQSSNGLFNRLPTHSSQKQRRGGGSPAQRSHTPARRIVPARLARLEDERMSARRRSLTRGTLDQTYHSQLHGKQLGVGAGPQTLKYDSKDSFMIEKNGVVHDTQHQQHAEVEEPPKMRELPPL